VWFFAIFGSNPAPRTKDRIPEHRPLVARPTGGIIAVIRDFSRNKVFGIDTGHTLATDDVSPVNDRKKKAARSRAAFSQ
jgi:hypothetical protein